MQITRALCIVVVCAWSCPAGAFAQSPGQVLVVVNESSADSLEIGAYYMKARGVPADHLVKVALDPKDEISRADYERHIEFQVAGWLNRARAHDRILYIVLTKGIPLRIAGTTGRTGTSSSVDSELALLYRRLTGRTTPPGGHVPNPFFLGEQPLASARPFTREAHDVFLVTRLDGFTLAEVKGLVDRALTPVSEGKVVLDMRAAWDDAGNRWLQAAADRLSDAGFKDRVVLETTSAVAPAQTGVLGYWSWGSNDSANKQRSTGMTFAPGALGGMFLSTDARTFTAPPDSWTLGSWANRASHYAGSPQSLAGDLIRDGISGASAYVAEPFLDGSVRPDILFPAYFAGYNLAEAFSLATPHLSWRTVIVGDPLCLLPGIPRPGGAATEPETDPVSEHGSAFTKRWVENTEREAAVQGGLNREAVKLSLKASGRLAAGDRDGAEAAAEQATAVEPRLVSMHFALASIYEARGEYVRAAERYRTILEVKKDDWAVLNNLAYHVATREHKPGDALPMAERAFVLSRGAPVIADTVAWIHHLLGNKREAGQYMGRALRGAANNAEVRYHAAAILQSAGQLEPARRELAKALELDPALAGRDDVKALQALLK